MRGVVIAGTASGVGKTVTTLAAIEALSQAGRRVQPAKAGPDFIDPSHHTAVADQPSRTLDPWLQGVAGMCRNYHRGEGDICVVEGMMGLYDGDTSTAAVAAGLSIPVVLVVDASAGMESVAATALGFREYAAQTSHELNVAGVIAAQAHGGRHEQGIRQALPDSLSYLGRVPPLDGLSIPERHLGLHLSSESSVDPEALDTAAQTIRAEQLLDLAREPPDPDPVSPAEQTGSRVAVARDAAFSFCYPATVERLRERAEVRTFSPVAGDQLPDCDAVYLPGGYPERHAAALARGPALSDIATLAADGVPVLGECGGLMALAETLTTTDGTAHTMAGVLPTDVTMHERYQALDHVTLRARGDTVTAGAGERVQGHEFHFSSASPARDTRFAFDMVRGTGIDGDHDGLTEYTTVGTYCHVHPESGAFDRFIDSL